MTQKESKHVALNSILCNKTVVFLTDTLYFICLDKHIGMTDVKKKTVDLLKLTEPCRLVSTSCAFIQMLGLLACEY